MQLEPPLELFPVEIKIKDRCSLKIEAPWIQVIELHEQLHFYLILTIAGLPGRF